MKISIVKFLFLGLMFFSCAGIMLFKDMAFSFLNLFTILLAVFTLLISRKNDKKVIDSLLKNACIIFTLVIFLTMIVRGTGIKLLGSEDWGGGPYIVLLFSCLLVIKSSKIEIDDNTILKGIIIYFLVAFIPFINELLLYLGYSWASSDYIQTAIDKNTIVEESTRLQTGGPLGLNLLALAYLLNSNINNRKRKIFISLVILSVLVAGLSGHRLALLNIAMFLFFYYLLNNKINKVMLKFVPLFAIVIIIIIMISSSLPFTFQRMIAFIPGVRINSSIESDVVGSTEWRLVIWEYILEHLKEYFIIGQGLTFSSSELSYLQNVDPNSISAAILTKNYHNGPLSMLIVFGIGGAVVLLFLMLYYYKLIKIIRFSNMDSNNKINGLTVFCAYSLTTFITFLVFYGDLTKMLPLIFTQLFILQMLLNQNSKLNIVKLDLK